jgi:hypothetical protein
MDQRQHGKCLPGTEGEWRFRGAGHCWYRALRSGPELAGMRETTGTDILRHASRMSSLRVTLEQREEFGKRNAVLMLECSWISVAVTFL